MKSFLTTILAFITTLTFAQKNDFYPSTSPVYEIENSQLIQPKGNVKNAEEAKLVISELLNLGQSYNLKLVSQIESPYQKHYTFIETYQGYEIYQAIVKVNTDKAGNITSVFNSTQLVENQKEGVWPNKSIANQIESKITHSVKLVWAKKNGQFQKCLLVNYTSEDYNSFEELLDANSTSIYVLDRTQRLTDADTIAKGYVFAPDPITSANTTYGGSFIDANDATNPSIDDERLEIELNVTFDPTDNTFYLRNDFVTILDLDPPTVPPVTSLSPDFYFDRSESGFEDVNALYHLTQQQMYLQSLGFTNLVNYAIEVDPHALSNSDNSLFNPNFTPPRILFGEGGVDDAEDADVIIHEYTHAIMHSASGNTNQGSERNALDEAFGDYMAASYSRIYEYYNDCCVYNWDGHNEYWNGRKVTSTALYPADLQSNLYKDAPMWSSALLRIERNVGREVTHKITLNAAFNYSSNMTMAQAAKLVLKQDSIIYNEQYHNYICYTFLDKGFVNSCKGNRPSGMVGVNEVELNKLSVLNSANFTSGTGNLEVVAAKNFDVSVYNLTGKLVLTKSSSNNRVSLHPNNFKSGVYIVKISFDNEVKSIKISKN